MAERTLSSEFRNVDNAGTADHLVQYLEYVDSRPETLQLKVNSYGYLGISGGTPFSMPGAGRAMMLSAWLPWSGRPERSSGSI